MTLREQVAQAIHNYRHYGNYADWSGSYPAYLEAEADVVLRVVVAALTEQIEALNVYRSRDGLRMLPEDKVVLALVRAAGGVA